MIKLRFIHPSPSCICEKCRKICSKISAKLKTKTTTASVDYKPQIKFYIFQPHDKTCSNCNISLIGREKKANKVNVNTMKNDFSIKTSTITTSSSGAPSSAELENKVFDLEIIKNHQKSVFAFMDSKYQFNSFAILSPSKKPYMQLKTLLSVMSQGDGSGLLRP